MGGQSMEAYKLSFYMNIALVLGISGGLLFSFFAATWINKTCLLYSMEVGLFNVNMGPGVVEIGLSMVLSEKLRHKLSFGTIRTYDFDEFHAWVCQIPAGPGWMAPCSIWDDLKVAKYVLIICGVFGISFLLAGLLMEWQYCNKPRKETKKIVRILYIVAPLLLMVGVSWYGFKGGEILDMVPRTEANVLERGYWFSLVLAFLSPAPILIQVMFAPAGEDELENEIAHAEKKNLREASRQQAWEEREFGPGGYAGAQGSGAYGTCAAAPAMMMPAQPGMLPTQQGRPAW